MYCLSVAVDLGASVLAAPIFGLGVTGSRLHFVTYYDGALLSAPLPAVSTAAATAPSSEADRPNATDGLVMNEMLCPFAVAAFFKMQSRPRLRPAELKLRTCSK